MIAHDHPERCSSVRLDQVRLCKLEDLLSERNVFIDYKIQGSILIKYLPCYYQYLYDSRSAAQSRNLGLRHILDAKFLCSHEELICSLTVIVISVCQESANHPLVLILNLEIIRNVVFNLFHKAHSL